MATDSSTLAWRMHGQRSLAGYSPWGRRELDMTERLSTPTVCWVLRLVLGTKCSDSWS